MDGLFSTPSYNTVGDVFERSVAVVSRNVGRQMVTNPAKKGKASEVLFDRKVTSVMVGDKYVDPWVPDQKATLSKNRKMLKSDGFKFSSPAKKQSGVGDYCGSFAERNPPKHEPDYYVEKLGELRAHAPPQPRNVMVSPPTKGTYGFPGTTIGKDPKYTGDSYAAHTVKLSQEAKMEARKVLGAPFKSCGRRLDFFDSQPNIAARKIYSFEKPYPGRKPQPPHRLPTFGPFKPTSPAKMGVGGTLSKFPEYKGDPFDAKLKQERAETRKARPAVVWKPTSNQKCLPFRTIAHAGPTF